MSLRVVTASGSLLLGDAPADARPCGFCGEPSQIVAEGPMGRPVPACAECVEGALVRAVIQGLTSEDFPA